MPADDVIDIADVLSTPQVLESRDPGRLLWSLATAGAQCRQAARRASDVLAVPADRPRSVLVATDASSSVAGDVLACLAGDTAPSVTWSAAELPRWAGAADALFVASADGRHPRLAELTAAASRRGMHTVVVAPPDSPIASAGSRGVVVPIDAGVPRRASLWSLLTPLLVALDAFGLARLDAGILDTVADDLDATAEMCRPTGDAYTNPAKQLAIEFSEALPVIAGAGPLACAAARWFVDSLALFAGVAGIAIDLPDDVASAGAVLDLVDVSTTTGLVDGFGDDDFFRDRAQEPAARPRLVVVGDDGRDDDPALISAERRGTAELGEIAARRAARALHEVAARRGVRSSTVEVPGGAPLARFAAATAFGDFTAAYLAIGRGVDPSAPRPGELAH